MRNRYLVSYDICNDKRLRKVHKTMLGYGERVQYSVFRCDLTPQERIEMIADLSEKIHHGEDQVLIVDLGPPAGRGKRCVEILGRDTAAPTDGPLIV